MKITPHTPFAPEMTQAPVRAAAASTGQAASSPTHGSVEQPVNPFAALVARMLPKATAGSGETTAKGSANATRAAASRPGSAPTIRTTAPAAAEAPVSPAGPATAQPYVNPFQSWVVAGAPPIIPATLMADISSAAKAGGSTNPPTEDLTQDETNPAGAAPAAVDDGSEEGSAVETSQQYLASFQNWNPNLPSYPMGTVNPLVEVPFVNAAGQNEVLWAPSTMVSPSTPISQEISQAEAAGYKVESAASAYEPSIVNGVPVYPS